LGKYHEDTGKTYYWIGRSLAKLKEFDEALVAFSRAMRIFGRVLAQNHKYRKWTSAAIEEVFKEVKDPDVDYELYMSALADSIAQEVKGDNLRKNKQFEKGKEGIPIAKIKTAKAFFIPRTTNSPITYIIIYQITWSSHHRVSVGDSNGARISSGLCRFTQ